MDRERAVRIASDYARRVRNVINPSDIILYGSYVKDDAGTDSDIDTAIVFDTFDGNYRQTVQKLHELTIS